MYIYEYVHLALVSDCRRSLTLLECVHARCILPALLCAHTNGTHYQHAERTDTRQQQQHCVYVHLTPLNTQHHTRHRRPNISERAHCADSREYVDAGRCANRTDTRVHTFCSSVQSVHKRTDWQHYLLRYGVVYEGTERKSVCVRALRGDLMYTRHNTRHVICG